MAVSIDALQAKKRELTNQLRAFPGDKVSDNLLKKIRAVEDEIQIMNQKLWLADFNSRHEVLRNKAKRIWECDIPEEDITCNDGSFHATKVKKYPALAALSKEFCAQLVFRKGEAYAIRIRQDVYEYKRQNPAGQYERLASFEALLLHNNIRSEDMTFIEYTHLRMAVDKYNQEFKDAVDRLQSRKEEFRLAYRFGLLDEKCEYLYKFINK